MNSNPNIANENKGNKPAIVLAIEQAYRRAHEAECGKAVSWVECTGWMLQRDHFEDLLLERTRRLSDDERVDLRDFRYRLIAERAVDIVDDIIGGLRAA